MRPLVILKCIAKASLKAAGRYVGIGVPVEIAEEVWKEWNNEVDKAQRRAELEAIVQMAAEDFRQQVEAIVAQVADKQPPAVRRHLSACLEQVADLARQAFHRADDQKGRSVPPGFHFNKATDLVPFVSFHPVKPAAEPEPKKPATASPRPHVDLRFLKGHKAGTEDVFTEPEVLIFGRGKDCSPRLPAEGHKRVSRNHCLLEIVLPEVRLRDLGSLHGTFVNGELLGKRPDGKAPQPGFASPDRALKDGDEVRLANQVSFRVHIHVPVICRACGRVIAEEEKGRCARQEGEFLCASCQAHAGAGTPGVRTCAWCHREVTDEQGLNRPGMFVCPDCKGNIRDIMGEMLGQAKAGQPELQGIKEYTFVEELGHGGWGAVFLAKHSRTEQAAAIKLMLPNVATDDRAVERFQMEIRNTMALDHRHVVRFLDHGYARGTFFMVLEFCNGGSVDQLMKQRGGPLSVDEAGEIILQALEGLEYAHNAPLPFVKKKGGGYGPGKGLVHRDLKPGNLFLSKSFGSGRISKVGDFGLAKAFEEAGLTGGTRTGERAGTWEFMCRQQVTGFKGASAEVDVWAMAASLYYMLTGKTPRDFPRGQDPWWVILETDPVAVRQREAKIPPKLAEVIDAALREEPIPFQTAAALKEVLEECL